MGTDRTDLATDVAEIRQEFEAIAIRFQRVMEDVRRLPGGQGIYHRIDAYPGVGLDRDMGAGQNADGWFAEVAAFLEGDGEVAAS